MLVLCVLDLGPQTTELGPGWPEEAQPCPGQQLQIPQELQEGGMLGREGALALPSAVPPGRLTLPAPGPAGSAPSAAARWAVPGPKGRLGPLAPGEAMWNQTPRRPVLSEMVPCGPHLPQGSLELV